MALAVSSFSPLRVGLGSLVVPVSAAWENGQTDWIWLSERYAP